MDRYSTSVDLYGVSTSVSGGSRWVQLFYVGLQCICKGVCGGAPVSDRPGLKSPACRGVLRQVSCSEVSSLPQSLSFFSFHQFYPTNHPICAIGGIRGHPLWLGESHESHLDSHDGSPASFLSRRCRPSAARQCANATAFSNLTGLSVARPLTLDPRTASSSFSPRERFGPPRAVPTCIIGSIQSETFHERTCCPTSQQPPSTKIRKPGGREKKTPFLANQRALVCLVTAAVVYLPTHILYIPIHLLASFNSPIPSTSTPPHLVSLPPTGQILGLPTSLSALPQEGTACLPHRRGPNPSCSGTVAPET